MITQWHDYIPEEKIAWLRNNVLKSNAIPTIPYEYDHNFIALCESKLTPAQRTLYIKYLSGDISIQTYKGMSDEECRRPETTDLYYWNFLTADVDLKGRCIWNVVAEYAP